MRTQSTIVREYANGMADGFLNDLKRAMGCGFDKDGKPYLWHTLLQYKARIQNMVHILAGERKQGPVIDSENALLNAFRNYVGNPEYSLFT